MAKVAGQRRFHGIIAGQPTTPIMLCKLGVVGSSPIVSTVQVLVTGLIFVLSRAISHRPCPLRAQNFRLVLARIGRRRAVSVLFEVPDDVGVLAVHDVLIAQCRPR